jgi:hypothetical protein
MGIVLQCACAETAYKRAVALMAAHLPFFSPKNLEISVNGIFDRAC